MTKTWFITGAAKGFLARSFSARCGIVCMGEEHVP